LFVLQKRREAYDRGMDEPSKQHHGREYFFAGISVLGEFLAVKYGINWLAWLFAILLCLSIYEYAGGWFSAKPALKYGIRALSFIVIIVITVFITRSKSPERLKTVQPPQQESGAPPPITDNTTKTSTAPSPTATSPALNAKGGEKNATPPPPKQLPASPVIEVGLRFVYPKEPALMIANSSSEVAKNIKWAVVLWNMDLPDRNDPLPIPTSAFDWLKAHDEGGPQDLFNNPNVAPLLKPGNRLFGSASVDCQECTRGKTYIVYIVFGSGGWFSEVKIERTGKLIIPKTFSKDSREEYFKSLEATIPVKLRIPIGER
jgi:hypothetical protein